MQVANVKLRQILPRVGKIWAGTPRCTSHLGFLLGVFAWVFLRISSRTPQKPHHRCQFNTVGWVERNSEGISVFQIPLKFSVLSSVIKNAVKPNFTLSAPRNLPSQSVGFHSVSDGCSVSGNSRVFLWFSQFWWHPFNLKGNPQKHPSNTQKYAEIPYQYAEIPKQKHPKQKHLRDDTVFS